MCSLIRLHPLRSAPLLSSPLQPIQEPLSHFCRAHSPSSLNGWVAQLTLTPHAQLHYTHVQTHTHTQRERETHTHAYTYTHTQVMCQVVVLYFIRHIRAEERWCFNALCCNIYAEVGDKGSRSHTHYPPTLNHHCTLLPLASVVHQSWSHTCLMHMWGWLSDSVCCYVTADCVELAVRGR